MGDAFNILNDLNTVSIFAGIVAYTAIPLSFALVDFIDALRNRFERGRQLPWQPTDDFTILVPIFGHMRYLKNSDYLAEYHDKVVICTTTHETKQFYEELDQICSQNGFRQHRSNLITDDSKDTERNPWKIFHGALHASQEHPQPTFSESQQAILAESAQSISTTYCMFLDGDTVCSEDLRDTMGRFVSNQYDLASVRVIPSNTSRIIEQMQSIEYKVAMDARQLYPWMTSGACMLARTTALRSVLPHHSNFFQGGDIEIGKLAKLLGYRVGHINTEFRTVVPSTFGAWFRQRIAWSSGDFRHAIINIGKYSWRHPLYFLYFTVVVYGLMPVRIWLAISQPLIIPLVIAVYWVLLFTLLPQYRGRYYIYFPFYAMIQSLVITPIGIVYYLRTMWLYLNMGIIRTRPHLILQTRQEEGLESI